MAYPALQNIKPFHTQGSLSPLNQKKADPRTNVLKKIMIRLCKQSDFAAMYTIINSAALAYKGTIPADRWKEPYMPKMNLRKKSGLALFSGAGKRMDPFTASWEYRMLWM